MGGTDPLRYPTPAQSPAPVTKEQGMWGRGYMAQKILETFSPKLFPDRGLGEVCVSWVAQKNLEMFPRIGEESRWAIAFPVRGGVGDYMTLPFRETEPLIGRGLLEVVLPIGCGLWGGQTCKRSFPIGEGATESFDLLVLEAREG